MADIVYPKRLLPKENYRCIKNFAPLSRAYLQRNLPADSWLKNEELDVSKIAPQSGHLADFSTNLVGIFLPEDRKFQLTETGIKDYGDLWVEGSNVKSPNDNHFYIDETLDAGFLLIEEIQHLEVPYDVGGKDGFIAKCEVKHTPISGNFWHVSLRWVNKEGDILNQKGKWRKRMLTTARGMLATFIKDSLPPDVTLTGLEVSIYSNE